MSPAHTELALGAAMLLAGVLGFLGVRRGSMAVVAAALVLLLATAVLADFVGVLT